MVEKDDLKNLQVVGWILNNGLGSLWQINLINTCFLSALNIFDCFSYLYSNVVLFSMKYNDC